MFTRTYGPYLNGVGDRTMVTVELTESGNNEMRLSITGEETTRHGRELAGGQAQGSAPAALKALWDRWHLNDMRPGCEHQEAQFREHPEDRPTYLNGYVGASGVTLSGACPVCGYGYGTSWKYEELPDDILEQIDAAAKGPSDDDAR